MKNPRWRVVILDDDSPSRSELAAAVVAAGGVVTETAEHASAAVDLVGRSRPDVGIFAVGLRDGDGVDAATAVMAADPRPIVLFTSRRGDTLIERAQRAGVMGYLLKPLRAEELSPVLDLAIARFAEIRDLRRRLESRKLIERAKGLLMARQGLSEEEAFRVLRRTAMNRRRSMAQIAQAVILAESMGREALAR